MALRTCLKADHFNFICGHQGRDQFNQNFRPVRPRKVVHLRRWTSFFFFLAKLSRLDRILDRNFRKFWLNGYRVRYQEARTADRAFANFVASHRTLGVLREKMASSSNQEEGKASRKHGFYVDDCFADTLK